MGDIRCPKCMICGNKMNPVFFTEDEYVIENGDLVWTGRRRKTLSHFVCGCGKRELVKDSKFLEDWS